MKHIVALIMFANIAFAQQTPQTAAQIQQQKDLANQSPIAGSQLDFRTALNTFESYYAGIVAGNATEFRCLTAHALKETYDSDGFTEAEKLRIQTERVARDEKDFLLVEFRFKADADHPEIIFSYRYNYKDDDGQRITTVEREKLVLTRTADGWKIDSLESGPQ